MCQPLECPFLIPHVGHPQIPIHTQQDLFSAISRLGMFSFDQEAQWTFITVFLILLSMVKFPFIQRTETIWYLQRHVGNPMCLMCHYDCVLCLCRFAGVLAMSSQHFSLQWWRCRSTPSFFPTAKTQKSTKGLHNMLLPFSLKLSMTKVRCRDLLKDPSENT